jgi:trehalose 6-phosphate synthase
LSQFAGAAQQLTEALIVNPYAIAETADALARALAMTRAEQAQRLRKMRATVAASSTYWWAGQMLQDVARLRTSAWGSGHESHDRQDHQIPA